IYVTHDQTEAMTLGQRVVVLNKGIVQQVDSPQGLYQRPQNTFVASFIGSPPMNFIRGRLDGDGVTLGPHRFALPNDVRSALRAAGGPDGQSLSDPSLRSGERELGPCALPRTAARDVRRGSPRQAPSRARLRRSARSSRPPASAGWRRGSTRSGRGPGGSIRRR